MIYELRCFYPLVSLFELFSVSKSGYYKWFRSRDRVKIKKTDDNYLKDMISDVYKSHNGLYGRNRLQIALKNDFCLELSNSKVYRLMQKLRIKAVIRRKKARYVNGDVKSDNVFKQDFISLEPLRKLCMDVSYIRVCGGFLYLSVICDLFNGEIVAYKISDKNDLSLVFDTLDEFCKLDVKYGAILHTDQGFQYKNKSYAYFLKERGIVQSMSGVGNCYDNAPIESFFGTLKCESLYLSKKLLSKDEARKMIDDYIHYYNNDRIKVKLKMSPVQYRLKQQKVS